MLEQQKNDLRADKSMSQTGSTQKPGTSIGILTLVAICIGYFMIILDTTVVNVALPDMQKHLGANVMGFQWILDGYSLVFASFMLTAGALGDRLGSKRIFLGGLALFTAASIMCGLAPTLITLVIARIIQGLGAALLVPSSLSLLSHSFPAPADRARAIAIWGGIAGIAAAAGPVLGGFLVNVLTWRSIFLINLPIGVLGFLLTLRFVSPAPHFPQRGLDLIAQLTAIVALATLTFTLIEGDALGWSAPPIVTALVIFVLATAAFILREWRTRNPMLPLTLFSSPTFSAGSVIGLLLNFGFYGQLFFMPLFFQQLRGLSSFVTGLALLPESAMVLIASYLAGRFVASVGAQVVMVIGLFVGCAGFLAMTEINAATDYLFIFIMLVAVGFGTAFTMPAMTAAVIESAPRERSGITSAVLNASRQIGSVLGVALLGSLISAHRPILPGMHTALLLAGVAFLLAALLALLFVRKHRAVSNDGA